MQHSRLNRAMLQVADATDVSGRVTAKSIQHGLYAKKQSSLGRIWRLTVFRSVAWVVVLASLARMPVNASEHGDSEEIADLKGQVAALQSQVQALQSQLAKVEHNKALLLDPFVTVDANSENGVIGPNIVITGANVHIVSGSGATDDNLSNGGTLTGLGNLIIGYDEVPTPPPKPGDRGGSHNLVIGRWNKFTQSAFGGLVVGQVNTISNEGASVSGGTGNDASGASASVSGGSGNTASGLGASVSGGDGNTASGFFASVSGGFINTASGGSASVSGGEENTADGGQTVVLGGLRVTDNNNNSIAPQPPFP